jgi:uncharacterized SAM-binding protein YcdF (DUF218 family)
MYYLVVELFQPFTLLSVLASFLVLLLWRKRGERTRLLWFVTGVLLALFALSTPLASYLALGTLEWPYPPQEERPDDVEAIVILSGGTLPANQVRKRPEAGQDSVSRCLEGVRLYHQGKPCPVVVSGGSVAEEFGPAGAPLMREVLVRMGVAASDILVEDQSRTTWENAVQTHQLLKPRGIHKILLVTDAAHLFRAAGCFRRQGLEVVPCGCRYRATEPSLRIGNLLPKPESAEEFQSAWHEWLGAAWYWLHGRI